MLDEKQRKSVARLLTSLFDRWDLTTGDRLALLGMNEDSRRTLQRYRDGEPIANQRDVMDRAAHLLAIHESLRILFREDDIIYGWMATPNRAFGARRPIDVVRDEGFAGLLRVRGYLDRARNQ